MGNDNPSNVSPPVTTEFFQADSGLLQAIKWPVRDIVWNGILNENGTSYLEEEGYISICAFEVMGLPDFSHERFFDLAKLNEEERRKHVVLRHMHFVSSLHAGTFKDKISISLRYILAPKEDGKIQIRLFYILKSFHDDRRTSSSILDSFSNIFQSNFPSEYYSISPLTDKKELAQVVKAPSCKCSAELIKKEELLEPKYPLCPSDFYYLPLEFEPSLNSLVGICDTLSAQEKSVLLDFTVVPTFLSPDEKSILDFLAEQLNEWGSGKEIEHYLAGGTTRLKPDYKAKRIGEKYNEIIERYNQFPIFMYSFRAASDSFPSLQATVQQIAATALSPTNSNYNIVFFGEGEDAFQHILEAFRTFSVSPKLGISKFWQWENAPHSIQRLHRLTDLKELSSFFRLPVPSKEGCPGVPLDEGRPSRESSLINPHIILGNFIERDNVTSNSVVIDVQDLAKHAFIAGVPGSGKTTACFNMLTQLWGKCNIPFMVFEPAKTEYRALKQLDCFSKDLSIFTIGNELISPFRINPFEVLPGCDVESHISHLNHVFNASLPLFGPMPMLIDEAIREVYYELGWSEFDIVAQNADRPFPTLNGLINKLDELIESKGYSGEVLQTVKAATGVRVGSLNRGSKGRMLNTSQSLPLDFLMKKPVIFELDRLNEDEQCFFILLMLGMINQYVRVNRRSGSKLVHALIVEEAHNLIPRAVSPLQSEDKSRSKAAAVNYFMRMLAEMRALGEGLVVCDQLPSNVAPDVVKNTNLKIMHRLTSSDDREELGKAMLLDKLQFNRAASLLPGEAFIFMEGWNSSRPVLEDNFKSIWNISEPQDDTTLKSQMETFTSRFPDSFRPFQECGLMCANCSMDVRNKAEMYLRTLEDGRENEEIKNAVLNDVLMPDSRETSCTVFLKRTAKALGTDDKVTLFCCYLHLVKARPDLLGECLNKNDCNCTNPGENSYLKKIVDGEI